MNSITTHYKPKLKGRCSATKGESQSRAWHWECGLPCMIALPGGGLVNRHQGAPRPGSERGTGNGRPFRDVLGK